MRVGTIGRKICETRTPATAVNAESRVRFMAWERLHPENGTMLRAETRSKVIGRERVEEDEEEAGSRRDKGKSRQERDESQSAAQEKVTRLAEFVTTLLQEEQHDTADQRKELLKLMSSFGDVIHQTVDGEKAQLGGEASPTKRSSSGGSTGVPVPPPRGNPQILRTFPGYGNVGTSAGGRRINDQVQNTSDDAHLAQWMRDNPTRTLEDYYTRPTSPPGMHNDEVPPYSGIRNRTGPIVDEGVVVLDIGGTTDERCALQTQRNEELRAYGKTSIVDQGIRWMEDGRPYDIWPPERLVQVRTYWDHQRGLADISGQLPEMTSTFRKFLNGNFQEAQPYRPRPIYANGSRHPSRRQSPDPPRRPSRSPNNPPPRQGGGSGGGGGGSSRGGSGDDSSQSSSSEDTDLDQYYGDERDVEDRGSNRSQTGGRDRRRRHRHALAPYAIDPDRRRRHYNRSVKGKYAQWIDEQLGQPIVTDPPGVRTQVVKVKEPDSWSGGSDLEKYEDWLQVMFRWMKINRLGGPDYEQLRVTHFCYYLQGKAGKWAYDNVESVNRRRRRWTLLQVVMGLYHHFIHETAIQDATERFDSAQYRTTAEDFYQALARLAQRMVYPPDRYTFRTRLMSGLPSDIRREVLSRGITAETSSTASIVSAARIAENTKRIMDRYNREASKKHRTGGSTTSTGIRTSTVATPYRSSRTRSTSYAPRQYGLIRRFRMVQRQSTSAPRESTTRTPAGGGGSQPPTTTQVHRHGSVPQRTLGNGSRNSAPPVRNTPAG